MLPPALPPLPPPLPLRPKKKSLIKRLFIAFCWIAGGGIVGLAVIVGIVVLTLSHGPTQSWTMDTIAKKDKKAAPMEREWPDKNPPKVPAKARTDASGIKAAEDFFSPTNLWLAKFHFTSEQWDGLSPDHVTPAKGVFGGKEEFPLQNTNASRNGLAGAVGLDFKWSAGEVELGGVSVSEAKVRFKGNGTYLHSRTSFKRPLKVEMPKGKKNRIAGEKVFNFGNLTADHSCLADTMAYEFFRAAGVPAPRTTFARVLLTIDGRFTDRPLGLYVMVEDVDDRFLADRFNDRPTSLFKPVTYHLFEDLGTEWQAYKKTYDPKKNTEDSAGQRVIECAKFVSHASDEEFARRCGEFFDLDETARFIAVLSLISSYDGFLNNGQNFYMYLDDASGRFGFIPWDLDHSWGGFVYTGTLAQRETASVMKPLARHVRLVERLFSAPAFAKLYRQRLGEIYKSQFDVAQLERRVDELAAVVRPVVKEESDYRIERFEKAVSKEAASGPRDGAPEDPHRPVHQLKLFMEHRYKSVEEQLAGKSTGYIFVQSPSPEEGNLPGASSGENKTH